ncbi:RNA polymerase sigma factor [Algoriphagus zhangzhouensis]|uniref:RNA polymerase sigma-70 factor, ECF subfamily n=1 Tax=Algoriphagus zhangzhouensis TaxID=1073327 RepID=A0A1M7ZJM4_9BACT|nr:RNA polymerase sigma factor [Algoriphagus zhangzhouensis]TDY43493.1 RNA polymerase sigma-70 factor (ECF subfamily) [Algoriphagus zhangzhouensis]SHO65110.1 RNA polymerase sigma-70 factor, ECF subfamily [Algoriphagus zhangzhouensis]
MKFKEDSEYILAIKKGDRKAFGLLVQKHQSYAYTLALRILKNSEDAKEVAQDSFIKIFHNLHNFQEKSAFKTWLYKIVYHESLGKLRKNKRQFVSLEDFQEDNSREPDYQSGLELLEEKDRKNIIQIALNKLRPAESTILTLYYLDEQSIKEIEEITDFTESNIKILLHRGRKNLIKELNKTHHKETLRML